MAKRILVVDDLDGTEGADTHTFALDGTAYEIDLSQRSAAKLRSVLGPFIDAARKPAAGGRAVARAATGKSSGLASEQLNAIREWARKNGYTVSDKGRISGEIMLAFDNAQSAQEPAAPAKLTAAT